MILAMAKTAEKVRLLNDANPNKRFGIGEINILFINNIFFPMQTNSGFLRRPSDVTRNNICGWTGRNSTTLSGTRATNTPRSRTISATERKLASLSGPRTRNCSIITAPEPFPSSANWQKRIFPVLPEQ